MCQRRRQCLITSFEQQDGEVASCCVWVGRLRLENFDMRVARALCFSSTGINKLLIVDWDGCGLPNHEGGGINLEAKHGKGVWH